MGEYGNFRRSRSRQLHGAAMRIPRGTKALQAARAGEILHSATESGGCFTSAGGAGAAAAAIAIKASGMIVHVEPDDFLGILRRQSGAPVVYATGGFFSGKHQYLTSYKGLAFFTKAPSPLDLPSGIELVQAKRIWVPGG